MTFQVEWRAIASLAVGCFVQVARLNQLQNEQITIDARLQFIKDTSDIDSLTNIKSYMFKNYLIASGKLIENSTFNNEFA